MQELIGMLTSQLGVNENQAAGGAGLLFKMAQKQLGGNFSQVTDALPGVMELMGKAPEDSSGLGDLAGMAMSAFGGESSSGLAALASMAGAFKSLDLDMETVAKFAPLVLQFVKSQGGEGISELLEKAFS